MGDDGPGGGGTLRRSPLHDHHRDLGARLVPFGGWEMPIQYRGVLEEHAACRERAVVFDVSHLGTVTVRGAGSRRVLQWALTNDLDRIAPGHAQYTHLLDERDAHVVDDIIVWWVADGDFRVMPNASNTGPLVDALRDAARMHSDAPCDVADVTAARVVLAVQGPEARALIAHVCPAASRVPRFAVSQLEIVGAPAVVAGTGYTGEDGVEIEVPATAAGVLWDALLAAGITPAGLGARDTLRLEAGLPLHGHELGPGITPLQAGLGGVVGWDKGDFRGRAPLEVERARGPARRLRGLAAEGRRPPRADCEVRRGDERVGVVTSGNFSPTLGHGIALALVRPDMQVGDAVSVDVRGSALRATVVRTPFVRSRGSEDPASVGD
jgi:aminomethyltransferase